MATSRLVRGDGMPEEVTSFMHVLVVDDDWRILDAIGMMFEHHPNTVSVSKTRTYEEVMKTLEHSSLDIACIDIHLGTYSGFDICRTLRRAYPRTYIVIVTADAGRENLRVADSLGTHALFKKPISLEDINKAFENYVAWKELLR